jgi:hypothetical protein
VRVAEGGPDADALKRELNDRGAHVASVSDAEVTLEDVFLCVVGGAEKQKKGPEEAKAS